MIQEIEKKDYPACVQVIRDSFQTVADEYGFTEENAPGFTAFAVDEAKLFYWREKQRRPMAGWFEDGKLVGYYNLLLTEEDCELGSLCVLPAFRHRGIGEELLFDAQERAKTLAVPLMTLSIVEENAVLRRWYERHGFVHTGTRKYDCFPFTCGYLEKPLPPVMRAYLLCFAMLQLCLYDTLEDGLHELLCTLSPELHSGEEIRRTELFKALSGQICADEQLSAVLRKVLEQRQESIPKTFRLLTASGWEERLPQAQDMAEELLSDLREKIRQNP